MVGEQHLTYAELSERANRMAHWLIAQGIGAENRVVVLLPRSADLVAALLAVWHAGGCYVPVDPDYPAARVRSVIDDCAATLVLDENLLDRTDLSRYPAQAPAIAVAPGQAAYTIYTSGSTGKPKGVVIGHDALTNFLASMQRTLRLSAQDRFAAVTTIAFDIAALELFLPLTTGARVVLANREHVANPPAMLDLVEQTGVTVMQATPALWQMLATHDVRRLSGVRVLTGGEALPRPLAEGLCAHAAQVINLYGPTETTVWSTLADVATCKPPSIGTPIANTQVLILDSALRPVPPGVGGDLWIAGDGLARGYHRQPGLTACRFVANPFGPQGARMYRTGDLARWSESGKIEFLGRADFQIKLRGFRIEPGDVEHALTRHPAVREAVVMVREDQPDDKRLVGYVVVAEDAETPPTRELQQFVREQLPDYMVPSAVVTLPAIPLTANGKLDRSRLPRPEASSAKYRAPESAREVALCGIFAEVLGAERVASTTTSSRSAALAAGHPACRSAAVRPGGRGPDPHHLRRTDSRRTRPAVERSVDLRPEASAQDDRKVTENGARLVCATTNVVHQSVRGPDRDLQHPDPDPDARTDRPRRAAGCVHGRPVPARDSAYRLRRARRQPLQRIIEPAELSLPWTDWGWVSPQQVDSIVAASVREGFDLSVDLPIRAYLLRPEPDVALLAVVIHHIAGDGGSLGPFTRDLSAAYRARLAGVTPTWDELPVQYSDYALWQRELLGDESDPDSVFSTQLRYWRKELDASPGRSRCPSTGRAPPGPAIAATTTDSRSPRRCSRRSSASPSRTT